MIPGKALKQIAAGTWLWGHKTQDLKPKHSLKEGEFTVH